MNGFPLPRTGRQLSAAKHVLFFPSAPVFHKTNLYLRNNTPPAASAIAGWIAYFLLYRPAFDLSSGFSKFLSIPSAPDKIRFDSAIF